jgi:hypothetical protein
LTPYPNPKPKAEIESLDLDPRAKVALCQMGIHKLFDIAKYTLPKLIEGTGLSEAEARRLKAKAELCQIKGIGHKISDLLFDLMIDSLSVLAKQNPVYLREKIVKINGPFVRQSKQIKKIPTHAVVMGWIEKAKCLQSARPA